MGVRVAVLLLLVVAVIAISDARSPNKELQESQESEGRVIRDAERRRKRPRKQKAKRVRKTRAKKKLNKRKQLKKKERKIKSRKINTPKKAPRQYSVYKGNSCEYFPIGELINNDGCGNGDKFVIKQVSGVRKQFFILDGKVMCGFVQKGKKFTECTSAKNVLSSISCKAITGLADVDLGALTSATTGAAAADTTAAAAAGTTAAAAAETTAAAAAETTAAAAVTTAAAGCTVNQTAIEVLEAAPLLFNTCNIDGTAGLTWAEVQKCIESIGGILPEGLIPSSEADFNLLAGSDLSLTEEEWKAWYCATVCCPT